MLETAVAMALVAVLLSVLVPALSSARQVSFRERCSNNQKQIGMAWDSYLSDHNNQFPTVAVQPGWMYGGMRFSAVNEGAYPDTNRPLTSYLPLTRTHDHHDSVWCCPADRGISDPHLGTGTGKRSAFRSFGTSYRANAAIVHATIAPAQMPREREAVKSDNDQPRAASEQETMPIIRGLHRSEITTPASRLLLMGDALWHEVAENTGRKADWHGVADTGNLLFLDGSVRFLQVRPREIPGPIVFDPVMPGSVQSGVGGRLNP